jgi:aminoglycoside phosphotransferase (APT) family kinase protein
MSDPSASRSQSTSAHPGIDSGNVSGWFDQNIPGVALPLQFRRMAGGRSNLTFEVRDAAGVGYVLRRTPVSHVLPTAHDMQREYRITALGPAGVPVPAALGLCLDETVNGVPFYVMAFVDGIVARTEQEARESLNPGHSPTLVPDFPSRADLEERYEAATGRDLSNLEFYVAFAYWRLACILESVYSRYVAEAMGDDGFDFSVYSDSIAWLGGQARHLAARSMIRTEIS